MSSLGTARATCWSITINNPTDEDIEVNLPGGWKVQGQIEKGENGTEHYQAMLTTPQIRFSAVKKVYPRAHIEVARNRTALQKYVHKDDTRVREVADRQSEIPTFWDYQRMVTDKWNDRDFRQMYENYRRANIDIDLDECALRYVDSLVATDIENGVRGVEFIAINPMWRSSWKKFWHSIIKRRDGHQGEVRQESSDETSSTQEDVS